MKKKFIFSVMIAALLFSATAVTANEGFDFDIGIDYNLMDSANIVGVSINADIPLGKWGVGVKGTLRYDITNQALMTEEWIPDFTGDENLLDKAKTAASLYLPVIRYVRYGWKGNPLYAKVGELSSVTIGTGVFVDGYTNMALEDELIRFAGAQLDIDGEIVGFPYIGFESFTNDVTALDLVGGRAYVKPLAFVDFYMLHNLQFGGSYVMDRSPTALETESAIAEQVQMYGADVLMPLIPFSFLSLNAYGDYAVQQRPGLAEDAAIWRAGVKGDIIGIINYGAGLTLPITEGFVPEYFNDDYDLDRTVAYNADGIAADNTYLNANAGFELLDEKIIVDVSVDGELEYAGSNYVINDPSVTGFFRFGEGIIPWGYFDASYTKNITGDNITLEQVLDGVLDPTKDSEIELDGYVSYSILQTNIGGKLIFDSAGEMTVTGNIGMLFNLF